jgi:hypothetical protein
MQDNGSANLFLNKVVQSFFMIGNPWWEMLINDVPLAVVFAVHLKNNAIAAVIGNVYMKEFIGMAG